MISRDFFSVAFNLGDSVAFNLESDNTLQMEIRALKTAIKVVCENRHRYTDQEQREMLRAIFDIADLCVDSIQNCDFKNAYEHSKNQFEIMKVEVEGALQGERDVDEVFREIVRANEKADHFPDV